MSIGAKGVSKSFRQGAGRAIEVLRDLEFAIQTGESLAVVGESGSGKSTLLSLMAGLDQPDHGEIRIESTRLTDLSESEKTRFRGDHIGIVFQQFHLMPHLTALENVGLPRLISGHRDWSESAEKTLAELGLASRLKHFPSQLSGGECQRVAIARALINRPRLLLADEPTGSLDVRTAEHVIEKFFEIAGERGVTLILVTHSERLAKRCRRLGELRGGRLWL